VTLAQVAHVCLAHVGDLAGGHAGGGQHRQALGLHLGQQPFGALPVESVQRRRPGAHEVEGQRGGQEPDRAQHAGAERRQQSRRAEGARYPVAVHRAGTPEREDGERARVPATLQDVDPRRARHALVDRLVDAPGRLLHGEAEGLGDPGLDGPPGGVGVQRHPAAQEEAGVEVAEHQVGVRHRRLLPAQPVGGRPGVGAGRVRAHAKQPQRVDAGDRAAAGSDLDHLDDLGLDGQAGPLLEAVAAIDLELAGQQRLAARDHGELGGGATEVEGEQVFDTGRSSVMGGGQRAPRRTGLQQPHREPARRLGRGDAAAGKHQAEGAGEAHVRQPRLQLGQVLLGAALHVDVGDRGRGALVLAYLRHHL